MSIDRNIPLKKPYIFTLVLLIIAGVFLTLVVWFQQKSGSVFALGAMGTLIGTVVCGVLNLIYLIPSESLFVRLITPGVCSVLLFLTLFHSSPTDLLIFLFFGVVNLLLGIYWYVSINRLKKEN
ncbi:MAG: hypothetical protein QNK23_07785 [Crocinitomicaceae bacterium]|nr:hypothetical protein [Crocinitomicaceae bacterium]